MKTKNKALLLTLCAVLLVVASVLGTMAYLTDTKEVKNTFTVGSVAIKLDEIDIDGKEGARTEEGNTYKLLPGQSYDKDPTVTVKAKSEESYVFMTVTVGKASELDKIFADHKGEFGITDVVLGYKSDEWTYVNDTKNTTANTRTYLFVYKEAVSGDDNGTELAPLFTDIKVPDVLSNTEIGSIEGMTITVKAYAIQKAGFDTAADAWGEFETTAGVSYPKAQA